LKSTSGIRTIGGVTVFLHLREQQFQVGLLEQVLVDHELEQLELPVDQLGVALPPVDEFEDGVVFHPLALELRSFIYGYQSVVQLGVLL